MCIYKYKSLSLTHSLQVEVYAGFLLPRGSASQLELNLNGTNSSLNLNSLVADCKSSAGFWVGVQFLAALSFAAAAEAFQLWIVFLKLI